ncbi:MAG: hypothetical protein QHJ73_07590 [Armatimonadota bacterium]|nr:hypothetical protein [Armatimonadota bacterium]
MERYQCEETALRGGGTGIRLRDVEAGLDALVLPELGADWAAFGVTDATGKRVELMHPASDFPRAGASPVLFPAVGRTRGGGLVGEYRRAGAVYPMPIHGFAKDLPWRVTGSGADATGAFISCELRDSAHTRPFYPCAFRLALTYRLREGVLRLEACVENVGPEELFFHLGYHPYFRAPVLPGGSRDRCVLGVPSREAWELSDLCATGRRVPLTSAGAYWPPRPLGGVGLDQVFANLERNTPCALTECWLRDPGCGWGVALRFDPDSFPVFVVYAPLGKEYVCLEPWTGLPGGLGEDTPAGGSARKVAPGSYFRAVVEVKPLRPEGP